MVQKRAEAERFRTAVQNVLLGRCKNNPRYSLRAFAKSVNVDPSLLSKIIRGKHVPSENLMKELGTKLDLDKALYLPNARKTKESSIDKL